MPLHGYELRLLENVERHGWQCLSVGGSEDQPPFSYSIGFWETLCTPELIVFGLDPDLSYQMLSLMFEELRGGATLADGARWPLLAGHDCVSRRVEPSRITRDHFNSALWYREHRSGDRGLEAFQLFWPEAQSGLFPWEKGCGEAVRALQPRLDQPAMQRRGWRGLLKR